MQLLLTLVLSATLVTLTIVFWVGVWAGYHVGYAHRGLVGCRPHRWLLGLWRWWARMTWRLLIGQQDGTDSAGLSVVPGTRPRCR